MELTCTRRRTPADSAASNSARVPFAVASTYSCGMPAIVAAAWTTTSMPSTARASESASFRSPMTVSTPSRSSRPVRLVRRTIPRTWWPAWTKRSAR